MYDANVYTLLNKIYRCRLFYPIITNKMDSIEDNIGWAGCPSLWQKWTVMCQCKREYIQSMQPHIVNGPVTSLED